MTSPRIDALPPHDKEAEGAVIASVLVDPEAWASVCGIVRPQDFFMQKNDWIFQACIDCTANGETLNQVTVGHQLARVDRLEELGGIAYLSRLVTELPTPVGVEHYARIVRRDALYRSAIEAASRVAQTAYRANGNVGQLLVEIETMKEQLKAEAVPLLGIDDDDPIESLAEVLEAEDEPLEAIITDGDEGAVLTVDGKGMVAGPPGLGKTNLLLRMSRGLCEGSYILSYAVSQPQRVLYVALEGSKRGLRRRLRKVWADADPEAKSRFFTWKTRLNLRDIADRKRLGLKIEQAKPTVLIIDPLWEAHTWDENSNAEGRELTGVLDTIIADYGVALLLAHHDRKPPPFAKQNAGLESVRGFSGLTGWLQFALGMGPETGNVKDRMVLVWKKTRDAEVLLEPLVVDFDREILDFIIDVNAAVGGKVSDDAILTAVYGNGGTMRGTELIEGFVHGAGASERTTREAIRALVKVGKLIDFVAPADIRTKAKSYRLPDDDEGLEVE